MSLAIAFTAAATAAAAVKITQKYFLEPEDISAKNPYMSAQDIAREEEKEKVYDGFMIGGVGGMAGGAVLGYDAIVEQMSFYAAKWDVVNTALGGSVVLASACLGMIVGAAAYGAACEAKDATVKALSAKNTPQL